MAITEQDINNFSDFARSLVRSGRTECSLSELFDQWTIRNPPTEDVLAIQASLRDMEKGDTGRPFGEFSNEFRKRNSIDDIE